MKYVETNYANPHKTITAVADHYVNISVQISDQGIVANAHGEKIVPAGTILGGGFIASETALAVKATTSGEPATSNAEGVLFHNVDVTHGPATGAVLIHGFIDAQKIPVGPTAEEVAALNHIKFVNA